MERVELSEFLLLSGLSSDELLSLLERGELSVEIGSGGAVGILLGDNERERFPSLDAKHPPRVPPLLRPVVEEVVATEILRFFENVLPDALQLAESWATAPAPTSPESLDLPPDPTVLTST